MKRVALPPISCVRSPLGQRNSAGKCINGDSRGSTMSHEDFE
jgi:hypothetical protein